MSATTVRSPRRREAIKYYAARGAVGLVSLVLANSVGDVCTPGTDSSFDEATYVKVNNPIRLGALGCQGMDTGHSVDIKGREEPFVLDLSGTFPTFNNVSFMHDLGSGLEYLIDSDSDLKDYYQEGKKKEEAGFEFEDGTRYGDLTTQISHHTLDIRDPAHNTVSLNFRFYGDELMLIEQSCTPAQEKEKNAPR